MSKATTDWNAFRDAQGDLWAEEPDGRLAMVIGGEVTTGDEVYSREYVEKWYGPLVSAGTVRAAS